MGLLQYLDSLRSRTARGLRDAYQNPAAFAEMSADRLKQRMLQEPEQAAMDVFNPAGALSKAVLAGVIKPKGGNWLSGSVEDALKGLKRDYGSITGQPHPQDAALNSWIEGPLTKYVKTRMASPEDEVRKLAESGVLHIPEPPMGFDSKLWRRRQEAGFSPMGEANTPLGMAWEGVSDNALTMTPKKDWIAETQATRIDPRVSADEMVYGTTGKVHDLGFNHLIDELSNALNPASGLPRNLQLSPEAVNNMSMEKAVRRVAEINAWRAAQKAETNRALAEQAFKVREYPHSEATPNPKGLRWVELKQGDLPEGWRAEKDALGVDRIHGPEGEATLPGNRNDPRYKTLADQLKYEGDTMGHCVGGYCDDVFEGRSRIFSLRDAKGEPHVTVEVLPGQEQFTDFGRTSLGISPDRIKQIKGKQNKAPNPEYLPFVQDFVRNSPLGAPWSEVGDLGNTGLRRITEERIRKELGDYATENEWADYMKKILPPDEQFAQGGSVQGAWQPTPGSAGLF